MSRKKGGTSPGRVGVCPSTQSGEPLPTSRPGAKGRAFGNCRLCTQPIAKNQYAAPGKFAMPLEVASSDKTPVKRKGVIIANR